jgi:hypothetical protein
MSSEHGGSQVKPTVECLNIANGSKNYFGNFHPQRISELLVSTLPDVFCPSSLGLVKIIAAVDKILRSNQR